MRLSAAARGLFTLPPVVVAVEVRAGPSMRAAMHRWMGRPLDAYPADELREILAVLEEVAFGKRRTDGLVLPKGELMARVAELDGAMEGSRHG